MRGSGPGAWLRAHAEGRLGAGPSFWVNFVAAMALMLAALRGLAMLRAPLWIGDLIIVVVVIWSVLGNLRMARRVAGSAAPMGRKALAVFAAALALAGGLFAQYGWVMGG